MAKPGSTEAAYYRSVDDCPRTACGSLAGAAAAVIVLLTGIAVGLVDAAPETCTARAGVRSSRPHRPPAATPSPTGDGGGRRQPGQRRVARRHRRRAPGPDHRGGRTARRPTQAAGPAGRATAGRAGAGVHHRSRSRVAAGAGRVRRCRALSVGRSRSLLLLAAACAGPGARIRVRRRAGGPSRRPARRRPPPGRRPRRPRPGVHLRAGPGHQPGPRRPARRGPARRRGDDGGAGRRPVRPGPARGRRRHPGRRPVADRHRSPPSRCPATSTATGRVLRAPVVTVYQAARLPAATAAQRATAAASSSDDRSRPAPPQPRRTGDPDPAAATATGRRTRTRRSRSCSSRRSTAAWRTCARSTRTRPPTSTRSRRRDVTRPSIVVVGETKRGKSSLVNMLIGVPDLSPVDAAVATASFLEFRHSTTHGARAYLPGREDPVPLSLRRPARLGHRAGPAPGRAAPAAAHRGAPLRAAAAVPDADRHPRRRRPRPAARRDRPRRGRAGHRAAVRRRRVLAVLQAGAGLPHRGQQAGQLRAVRADQVRRVPGLAHDPGRQQGPAAGARAAVRVRAVVPGVGAAGRDGDVDADGGRRPS